MGVKIPGQTPSATNRPVQNAGPVSGGVNAPNLATILSGQLTASRCGEEARKYVDTILASFKDNNKRITSMPIPNAKIEGRVFIDEDIKAAIIILFAETNGGLDGMPAAERGPELAAAVKGLRNDITNILCSVVIDKPDYACADKMAVSMMNSFQSYNMNGVPMTIDSLKGLKFAVFTNPEKVRAYIQEISPHAIPARDDIGVLVCIEEPRKATPGAPNFNSFEKDYTPLFAMTGYTRMMSPEQAGMGGGMGSARFVPIPTISDIVTNLPDRRLLTMALPIAADAFILQSLWSRPYTSFSKDRPNLGSLMLDTKTKAPMFLSSPEDLNGFANMYLTNPFLAIDVADGRFRMLGIDDMVYNFANVVSSIESFLHTSLVTPNQAFNPVVMGFKNWTGTVQDAGRVIDSRHIDYLSLATKTADTKHISHFLTQPHKPGERMEQIRALYPEAKALYSVNTLILDSSMITQIAAALTSGLTLTYDTPTSATWNITQLLTSGANNYQSFNTMSRGFGPSYYNPAISGNPYTS